VSAIASGPPLASAIYEGTLGHWRAAPERSFEHRVAMFYLDLDELPGLLGGRLVRHAPGLLRFRRRDYHAPDRGDLAGAVRTTVERHCGRRPAGPVRILTTLRTAGICFNPVSFYYCFDAGGEELEAVVAEVTNTPWNERHAYVLSGGGGEVDKALHVSPFFGMDHRYACNVPAPDHILTASIDNVADGRHVFSAGLQLTRVPLTAAQVRRVSWRYPFGSARVLALIYGHALGIRLSGVRVLPHPKAEGSRN
jgi:uncharacterized protein